MKKRIALVVSVLFVLGLMLSACGGGGNDGPAIDVSEAEIEDAYEVFLQEQLPITVAGQRVDQPQVRGMKDLNAQRTINGTLQRFVNRTASTAEGTNIPRYDGHEVMHSSGYMFSIKFIADDRSSYTDEFFNYAILTGTQMFDLQRIFGTPDNNDNFQNVYDVFETNRAQQNQQALSYEDFPAAFIGFTGDDPFDLTLIVTYYQEGKNEVTFPLSSVYDHLSERGQEFMAFVTLGDED